MSGHSKWATIKHKKGAADAARGKVFSKLTREITVAAKAGGGDPDSNPRLRSVILKAKEANMPSDNISRAVKKGTGELPGVTYEETTYEAYGPGGVGILVEVLTDNKNRTSAEIRSVITKQGGSMAGAGSVSYLFTKKGHVTVPKGAVDEEKLFGITTDAGAEDFNAEGEEYEITIPVSSFEAVKKVLDQNKIKPSVCEVTMLPANTIPLGEKEAKTVVNLVQALEDHDDVQNVYSNFDISDEILSKISGA